MNKTTEALKLAEKTLRDIIRVYKFETGTPVTALAAIREALAEPVKQEPVATVNANDEGYWADILPDRDVKVGQLLYVAPVSVEAAVLAERKRCAEACYLRAQSWKDNAARAAKLCGDAITSMGDTK